MSRSARTVLLLATSLLLFCGFSFGQTPPAAAPLPPGNGQSSQNQFPPMPTLKRRQAVLKATTRLVVLDVLASDKHGSSVTDLKLNDFTVLENGKEQKVSAFRLEQPSPPMSMTQVPWPSLGPNEFSNVPQFEPSHTLNAIVLDSLTTTPENQAYGRQQIIKYLERMSDNQPIALFAATQTGVHMLQDFTPDSAVLKQAARKYGLEVGLLTPSNSSGLTLGGSSMRVGGNLFRGRIGSLGAASYFRNLGTTASLAALQELAHTLAAYPGRKNLIWISEGFPSGGLVDTSLVLGAFAFALGDGEATRKTERALVDSQVAVYPVDPWGLAVLGFSAADSGAPSGRGRAFGRELGRQSSYLFSVHGAMNDLAQHTGGKAYCNRNDVDRSISRSIQDGSTYYMLGYYPTNKNWSGEFRKIEIKVNRQDITLRHRPGYYATDPESYATKTPQARTKDMEWALSLDTPVATMLWFRAQVLPPSAEAKRTVVIHYAVDPRALVFKNGSNGREQATVECATQAYSKKGKPVAANGSTIEASLKPETFKSILQSGFPCTNTVELPAGNYLLKLAVRTTALDLSEPPTQVSPCRKLGNSCSKTHCHSRMQPSSRLV